MCVIRGHWVHRSCKFYTVYTVIMLAAPVLFFPEILKREIHSRKQPILPKKTLYFCIKIKQECLKRFSLLEHVVKLAQN